jgi:hypothetical protein
VPPLPCPWLADSQLLRFARPPPASDAGVLIALVVPAVAAAMPLAAIPAPADKTLVSGFAPSITACMTIGTAKYRAIGTKAAIAIASTTAGRARVVKETPAAVPARILAAVLIVLCKPVIERMSNP